MSFSERFFVRFADHFNNEWRVRILEDGANFSEELTAAGNPVTISYNGDVSNKNQVIFPCSAKIRVLTDNPYQLHSLLYSNDRRFKVDIYQEGLGISDRFRFTGWILPYNGSEPRTSSPEFFEIECTDGLTDLANHQYLNNGELYDEWQTLSQVISNCLAKTGLSLPIWENIDTYFQTGQADSDSTFLNTWIHTKSYGERPDEVLDCLSVLRRELLAFNARIYQKGYDPDQESVWWIEKTKLKNDSTSPVFRRLNSGGAYTRNATVEHELEIKDDVIIQGKDTRKRSLPPISELTIESDRNAGYNLIPGLNFEDQDFPTASTINHWGAMTANTSATNVANSTMAFTSGTVNGEKYLQPTQMGNLTAGNFDNGATISNNGGNVRIETDQSGFTTGDLIALADPERPEYCTMCKITGTAGSLPTLQLDTNIPYTVDSDTAIMWRLDESGKEMDGLQVAIPLGQSIQLLTDSEPTFQLRLRYKKQSTSGARANTYLPFILESWTDSTNYVTLTPGVDTVVSLEKKPLSELELAFERTDKKNINSLSGQALAKIPGSKGGEFLRRRDAYWTKRRLQTNRVTQNTYNGYEWTSHDTDGPWGALALIKGEDNTAFKDVTIDFKIDQGSGFSDESVVYLTIFNTPSGQPNIQISEIELSMNVETPNETLISTITNETQNPMSITLSRFDADSRTNNDYLYLNPYRISPSGDYIMETTWFEGGGGSSANLEDFFQANVEQMYGDTSLILEGAGLVTLSGSTIDLYNTFRDTVDFNRLWTLGRLSHDIKFRAIQFTAIEMIPGGDIFPEDPHFETGNGWTSLSGYWVISGGSASYAFATNGAGSDTLYWTNDKLNYNNKSFEITVRTTSTNTFTLAARSGDDSATPGSVKNQTTESVSSGTNVTVLSFSISEVNNQSLLGLRVTDVQSGDTININWVKVKVI